MKIDVEFVWSLIKVYFNNPNPIIHEDDKVIDYLQKKSEISPFCNSLGIIPKRDITFKEIFTKIQISNGKN